MAIFGLWVINKAGGLVYQRNFADGLAQLTSNEYLVLAGTLHGIHAITSRLSPINFSSGAHVIEGESFKMTIFLTATGTKFVLLTSVSETTAESILQKVYEAYADAVMKNPFYTPEMPIRSDGFETRIAALLSSSRLLQGGASLRGLVSRKQMVNCLKTRARLKLVARGVLLVASQPSLWIVRFIKDLILTMQAQATVAGSEAQTLSSNTSLQCVETLLKAGIGCIAYLRGLLPYDNFSEYHLSAQLPSTSSTASFDNQIRPTVSGVTIMSLKRGFTNEGDRILDYLEKGIFEAIEKQYLRRFIFAIYLDSKDPNNVVEAYTFNFQYYKVAGTDIVVPIMSLGDQLSKMSLHRMGGDPVIDAFKRGNLPTLGDVKRALKLMIKTLVTTISQMDTLPKCRYGNFKLFFNDNTPEDYQPPYFQAGDADSNRWFFTTHRAAEVPESTSIGNLETGWHGVSMKVVSVSSFLPSSTEDNNATFAGLTTRCPLKLTPVEEARLRAEDAELQRKDASNRNVVWDADADEDAVGEEISDEGIVLARCSASNAMVPIGVRGDEGQIVSIPVHDQGETDNVVKYGGHRDPTPTHVGNLVVSTDMEETQVIPATQEIDMQSPSPLPSLQRDPPLPSSDIRNSSCSFVSTQQVDTLVLQEKLLDSERKRLRSHSDVESPIVAKRCDITSPTGAINTARGADATDDDGGVNCDCGTTVDDSSILCEGECNKWQHVWCMGYHGTQDKRLPSQFICFDCRLRCSPEWEMLARKTYADMVSRFKDLALFRRAIKVFEVHKPNTTMQFREQIGCPAALVNQLLIRLEDEGFITTENAISEDLGSARGDTRKGKKSAKNKGRKAQKELQKTKYLFLPSSKRGQAYLDYFCTEPQVENRLLGLTNGISVSRLAGEDVHVQSLYTSSGQKAGRSNELLELDSQTQEPTQSLLTQGFTCQTAENLKRKAAGDSDKTAKRFKISIGTGVDLCD